MKKLFDDDLEKDESQDFARMFESSLAGVGQSLKAGDKIRGEVLSIGKEEVFFSTGTVHDGSAAKAEFLQPNGELKIKKGDFVDLFVSQVKGSEIRLSTKPGAKNLADDLEDAYDMMLPVEGKVTELVNGGYRVQVNGKSAFCPFSQIDLRRAAAPEDHLQKKYQFLITQFSEGGRNIILSRRKLLEEEKEQSLAAFQEDVKPGSVVSGAITRLEPFGAFVELAPGLEGLVHISEISWSRIKDPSESVKPGQVVQAKVLRVEDQGGGRLRISLSIKQAGDEPWATGGAELAVGQTREGRVTRCMKFGAFVELMPGIEGLVPLSEMSYTKRVMKAEDMVKEGELISVLVKEINPDDHKVLLSLRDASGDPWGMVPQNFPQGSVHSGKVTRREVYGLFVELAPGITALLPKSKSHDVPEFSFDKVKVGDQISVQVSEIDFEGRKMQVIPPADPDAEQWKNFQQPGGRASMGTLADQFKAALQKGQPQRREK